MPDCHGTKGTGVDRMPWCETLRKWVNWTLHWLGYLWPWIVKVKLYLGNVRPECHGMKGAGVDRNKDALMWNTKEMSQQNAALTGVLLTFAFDYEFSRSNYISGMGGPLCMERKGWESIGCPDVKDNHSVTSRQRKLLGTGVTEDVGVSVDSF